MKNFIKYQILLMAFVLICTCANQSIAQQKEKNYNLSAQSLLYRLYYDVPKEKTAIGFLGENFDIKIKPQFVNASDFFGDYANVISDSTYGYVNKKGDVKLFPGYQSLYWFYSDIGIAEKNNKFGLIDRQGKEITPFIFDVLNIPSEGYYSSNILKKLNFIDEKGKFLFADSVNITGTFIYDGLTTFGAKDKYGKFLKGIINTKSEVIIKPLYTDLTGYFKEGLMRVSKDGNYGFINHKGEEVIPLIYQDLGYTFVSDYVSAKKDGKWGIINRENKVIIPFEYDGINNFEEELAAVWIGQKYGYVSKGNELSIPIQFELIWQNNFSDGLAVFKANGKYGFINKKGVTIISPIYDQASSFKNGVAHIVFNGRANIIDKNGKTLIKENYKEIFNLSHGLFKFIK